MTRLVADGDYRNQLDHVVKRSPATRHQMLRLFDFEKTEILGARRLNDRQNKIKKAATD